MIDFNLYRFGKDVENCDGIEVVVVGFNLNFDFGLMICMIIGRIYLNCLYV